jgi:hypothetical protein
MTFGGAWHHVCFGGACSGTLSNTTDMDSPEVASGGRGGRQNHGQALGGRWAGRPRSRGRPGRNQDQAQEHAVRGGEVVGEAVPEGGVGKQ